VRFKRDIPDDEVLVATDTLLSLVTVVEVFWVVLPYSVAAGILLQHNLSV
jgi:hypothetical protein